MAKKEQIQKIVDSLVEGTKDGSVIWKKTNSIFNSETRHQYSTTTEDGKTKFDFEIHLDNNFQPETGRNYIYMYNDDLIDGKIQIPYSKYDGLKTLQVLIYNKWVKATLPTKNESSVLDDILNKIGDKQSRRDRVLDDILLDIPKEKEEPKKKSIWQRLGL
jgi:hypothetical protein